MDFLPINFQNKFDQFNDYWSPKIVAQMNEYHLKIAKIFGEFIWHKHDDTDETFIVIKGEMRIAFRDGLIHLKAGEMLVVPMGVEHKPIAERECHILLLEPAGTVNTGDIRGDLTVEDIQWI